MSALRSLKVAGFLLVVLGVFAGLSLTFTLLRNYSNSIENAKQAKFQTRQYERTAVIDKQIEGVINELRAALAADEVRVSLVVTSHTGPGTLPRIDNTHIVVAPGRAMPMFATNIPISQWSEHLPDLINGNCIWVGDVDDLREEALRERSHKNDIGAFVGCPLLDSAKAFFGGVFATWATPQVANQTYVEKMKATTKAAASEVARYLTAPR